MSMELDNDFSVPSSPAQTWDALLDVERIAPCMPGATVEAFDGEVVTGSIKVKVGPVSLTYRGTAKFIERDPAAQVVILEASGKETRGSGTASATIRAALEPMASGGSTRVVIHTTMNVTGRPAQFGRGVIAEVAGKLIEKFAGNLAQLISESNGASAGSVDAGVSAIAADGGTQDAGGGPNPSPAAVTPVAASPVASPVASAAAAPVASQSDDSLNLVRLVGPAILKRVVPVAAAVAVLALLGRRFRHLLRRGDQRTS